MYLLLEFDDGRYTLIDHTEDDQQVRVLKCESDNGLNQVMANFN